MLKLKQGGDQLMCVCVELCVWLRELESDVGRKSMATNDAVDDLNAPTDGWVEFGGILWTKTPFLDDD